MLLGTLQQERYRKEALSFQQGGKRVRRKIYIYHSVSLLLKTWSLSFLQETELLTINNKFHAYKIN